MEPPRWDPDLAGTYDRVAKPYGEQFFHELDRKPFDRELLDRFAARGRGRGRMCDVGCGPGHVGRYLVERGAPYEFEYQTTRVYAAGVKR